MAINLGRKFVRRTPRNFVAGGTGVNPRLSSGFVAARPNAHPHNKPVPHIPVTAINLIRALLLPEAILLFGGVWWLDHSLGGYVQADWSNGMEALSKQVKKTMEEKGVSRAFCEAKVEELNQKIKSGSASED